jgi:hypothetical protein
VIDPVSVFSIANSSDFEQTALEIFNFQAQNCRVYADFIHYLRMDPLTIRTSRQIPFLPVEFFKNHEVNSSGVAEIVFTSSGTTGMTRSRHLVSDVSLYVKSYQQGFRQFYGDPANYVILALLPSYQERDGSSLIYMIDGLIGLSDKQESGYVLHNPEALYQQLTRLAEKRANVLLIGVTYALLDFVERYQIEFPGLIVMETGGMKGRRKEMTREELHGILCQGFGVTAIHSEYGMTELLSQAYSKGGGTFHCPPWMSVRTRDMYDPLTPGGSGATGGINIVDLANLNSCSFIATQDLGRVYEDGSFEILGRFDNSDIRGCNLLVQ